MAIVLYLFVLLIAAGGVLFGLDLATSPLSPPPNVPIGRSVQHVASAPEAPNKIERRQQSADVHKQADDRALTPVYPASPGPSAPIVAAQTPDVPDGRAAQANAAEATLPQRQDGQDAKAPEEKAEAGDGPDASAQASPTAQASCNIAACSAAYRSFTAADCTYQPLRGPRRLCTKSGAGEIADAPSRAREATAARASRRVAHTGRPPVRWIIQQAPQRRGLFTQNSPDDSEAVRIVRQMTRGRPMGDIAVQRADGSIVIVHTGEARAQAYR